MPSIPSKLQPITEADEWFAGEQKVLQWPIVDRDNQPVDPTGWATEFYLRTNKSSNENVLTLTGLITDDLVQVTSEAADTLDFEQVTYYYELWRTDTGVESVLAYGPAVIQ